MTETDDGVRAKRGVVVCLRTLADGRVRIVFDDVNADSVERPASWKPTALFTWTQLQTVELSDKQLAEIGLNLVTRLRALGATDA